MEGSKVNCFRRNLAQNEHKIQKSVAYRCVERKTRIAIMCRLCKFIVPVFGRFCLKCATYSFNGAWLPCRYRPVGVTRTCFIDHFTWGLATAIYVTMVTPILYDNSYSLDDSNLKYESYRPYGWFFKNCQTLAFKYWVLWCRAKSCHTP